MEGIQEIQNAVNATLLLSVEIVKLMKKHAGVSEVVGSILGDEALKTALLKTYEGVSKIPAEVKDLDMSEGIQLAVQVIEAMPGLIAALKS